MAQCEKKCNLPGNTERGRKVIHQNKQYGHSAQQIKVWRRSAELYHRNKPPEARIPIPNCSRNKLKPLRTVISPSDGAAGQTVGSSLIVDSSATSRHFHHSGRQFI